MFTNILVPTDGSSGSAEALERGISLAAKYDATLHALYVVDVRVGYDTGGAGVIEPMQEAGEDAVSAAVEQANDAGVEDVTGEVVEGVPTRSILDYADENGVDLIVMGTHGRTGFEHFVLGSVTEKVVRLSDVPVLTVPIRDGDK